MNRCTYTPLLVLSAGSLLRPVQPNARQSYSMCTVLPHRINNVGIKFHSDIPQIILIGAYLFCQENKKEELCELLGN